MHSKLVLLCYSFFVLIEEMHKKKEKCANITRYSQAVTHLSTNRAQRCLTSVIEQELVLSYMV